ncbi:ZN423-like protein [Mya arenaria]|uniref:ZN423-like protein n=1 Tax=Mya arenaria TaxID=6604 RepID=A0ABY7EP33_MYAAR|nr:ZN423-like protein [Mya arenaria]
MSRRKQARPRLIKREDEEEEAGGGAVALEDQQPVNKKPKLSESSGPDDVTEATGSKETEETETAEKFRCETCGATFSHLSRFMDHKNSQCEPCAANGQGGGLVRSDTPSSIDSLGSTSGPSDSPLPDMDPEQVPHGTGVSEAYPVGCQWCEKAFASQALLHVHERVHKDELPHSCTRCARVFKSKRARDRHVKFHNSGKTFSCTRCDFFFTKPEALKAHMKTHEAPEVYPCQICDLEYPTMAALMSHQNAHKPKPVYTRDFLTGSYCPECGDVLFTDKDRETHTCPSYGGRRTFHCQHCSAICVGPTALALHTEHAHSASGTEQNKCPLCFKCFLTLDELTVHMKVHDSPVSEQNRDSMLTTPDYHGIDFGASILSKTNGMGPNDILICPYCFRDDFDSLEGLELHMQSVHSVKPTEVYTCNYCNAPYKNLYSLHEHMRAIHQNQPSMGIKYPCSRCGKEYPSIESLQEHKKRVHYKQKPTETVYTCTFCTLIFVSASALNEHVKSSHAELSKHEFEDRTNAVKTPKLTPPARSPRPPSVIPISKESPPPTYSDVHTIINVPEPSQILRHLRSPLKTSTPSGTIHHGGPFEGRHMSSPPARPSSSGSGETIKCEQCTARFTDPAAFQKHIQLHLDSALGQFSCRQCQKTFLTEEQLELHLSLHFLSLRAEFRCKSCDKAFSKPDELQKHLLDIHAHHMYKCALCEEVYDSKVNIQVHFAIKHSDECKLYRCMACDVIFRSEADWHLHLRCHLATHNKPFKCPMCDDTFLVEFLLDKHLQHVHSGTGSVDSPNGKMLDGAAKIKVEKSDDISHQETRAASLLFNASLSPASGKKTSGTLVAGSATLLGDDGHYFHKMAGISFLGDGSGPLCPAGPGTPSSAGSVGSAGSLVWKSPEDLFRCNICDMKFSQLSGLQTHKLQDHGLKLVSGSKHSPSLSPHQSNHSSGDALVTSVYGDIFMQTGESSGSENHTSLLQNALTSSLGVSLSGSPESSGVENSFSEKLVSSFGEKLCLACPFCSQTFKCKADLEKHSKIHLNTGSQKCNICDEVFTSTGVLAEHKLTHCKIQQGNICVACKIPIKNEEQFYLHSQEHGFQGAVMQCIVCRQTLASMLELQMHGKHHFQTKAPFHTCCVCLNSFDSGDSLISKLNSSGRTYYVCKACYNGSAGENVCKQCGAKFGSPTALDVHMATHRKSYQCIKCQDSFSSEQEIQMHVATHMMTEGNVHECFLCFVVLDSPAKLQCHLIEHSFKDSEYRCTECSRMFKSAHDIQGHALEHGVAGRKYACFQCSQKFFFSAELENHQFIHRKAELTANVKNELSPQLTIHPLRVQTLEDMSNSTSYDSVFASLPHRNQSVDADLRCSKCDRTYASIYDLADHYKAAHAGADRKAYVCPTCSECFRSVGQLQTHFLKHHGKGEGCSDRGRQLHVCHDCGKECSSEHNLLSHMNTHRKGERFSCSKCGRTFSTSAGLSAHVASKCPGVPHECPICHDRFTKKSQKMEHMKSHSGDKEMEGRAPGDEDAGLESRSGTSEETPTSVGQQSDEETGSKGSFDGEKDGAMKPEVSSTCSLPDESSNDKA